MLINCMKQRLHLALPISCLIYLLACRSEQMQERPAPKKYAEMRLSSTGKTQIIIRGDVWRGLITPHGFGGYAHNIYYWSTLQGDGPIYANPILWENAPISFQHDHVGSISIDKISRNVAIDLRRIISRPGEPQRTEPSPANGIYSIVDINHDLFRTP